MMLPPTKAVGGTPAAVGDATSPPVATATVVAKPAPHMDMGEIMGEPPTLGGITDASMRRGFVGKVFGLLSLMLLETFAVVAYINFHEPTRLYFMTNRWLYWTAFVLGIGALCFITCKPDVAKSFPKNYIVLFCFAGCEGLMMGTLCAYYTIASIFLAVGMTIGVTIMLMAFAFCTKIDFTAKGVYLYTALWVLILWGFVASFVGGATFTFMSTVYAAGGVMLFSMYIIHDTQLIIGGQHKAVEFNVDEYVFAALNLYLDMLNLFVFILSFTGDRR